MWKNIFTRNVRELFELALATKKIGNIKRELKTNMTRGRKSRELTLDERVLLEEQLVW